MPAENEEILRKLLEIFGSFEEAKINFSERKNIDASVVTDDDDVRLKLILNTFNNIGEILFYEESKVVVTDPMKFRERIVEDIIDHEIIEKGHQENENSRKIQDALYKGLFLKNSLDNHNADLDRDEIERTLKENETSQAQILKESSPKNQQSLSSRGFYFQEEKDQFWSVIETAGLGVRITPLATFIPLLISEKAEEAIQEAATTFGRQKRKFNFSIRYDVKNLAGNTIDLFHEFTKIAVKEFRLEVCYSRNIEKRTSNCLVSAIAGKTGLYVQTDEDQCYVCLDQTQGTKIRCAVCQKSRVHVHCAQGIEKCLNCQAGVSYEEAAKEETEFLFRQYQRSEGPDNFNSLIVELSSNDEQEVRKAADNFDQIVEDTVRGMRGYVKRSIVCSECLAHSHFLRADFGYSHFLRDELEDFGHSDIENFERPEQTCPLCNIKIGPESLLEFIHEDSNFRDMKTFSLNSESEIYFDGGLKICRRTADSKFEFNGRLARPLDFDKVVSHLRAEERMLIIGPMIELEIRNHGDVVPAGILMSPAHLLTVPLEQFRDTMDSEGDVHYVLKVTKVGEKFSVKKYPNTGKFDSKFCLEADFSGESLCYVTTGIPLLGFGAGRKVCNHSAIKTFHTIHDTRKCPQQSNALELFGVCEGSEKRFEKTIVTGHKASLEMQWTSNIEPSLTTVYKIRATLGRKTTEFEVSHELLCRANGVLPFGSMDPDYPEIDCKEIDFCNVIFVPMEKKEGEEFKKQGPKYGKNFRCEHQEDCNKKKSETGKLKLKI